jgi:hypothetical protein
VCFLEATQVSNGALQKTVAQERTKLTMVVPQLEGRS